MLLYAIEETDLPNSENEDKVDANLKVSYLLMMVMHWMGIWYLFSEY